MGKWPGEYTAQLTIRPGRQPDNETGIYLHQHKHRWIEGAPHTWPNGSSVPTWRCSTCGDVICTKAKK